MLQMISVAGVVMGGCVNQKHKGVEYCVMQPVWWESLGAVQGFFQGGGSIRPPLEAGCPPLRGSPFTYSITFDIVHVESFPC